MASSAQELRGNALPILLLVAFPFELMRPSGNPEDVVTG